MFQFMLLFSFTASLIASLLSPVAFLFPVPGEGAVPLDDPHALPFFRPPGGDCPGDRADNRNPSLGSRYGRREDREKPSSVRSGCGEGGRGCRCLCPRGRLRRRRGGTLGFASAARGVLLVAHPYGEVFDSVDDGAEPSEDEEDHREGNDRHGEGAAYAAFADLGVDFCHGRFSCSFPVFFRLSLFFLLYWLSLPRFTGA